MDPLETFRAAVSAKYDIKPLIASGAPASSLRSATHLRLSTAVTFQINTPTRLRKVGSSATDPASEPDGFFMLDAVYLAWSLRDTPGGEYMKQAREHGFPAGGFVGLTERKSIVDWLKRAVTVLDSIVPLSGMFFFIFKSTSVPFHPERTQSRQHPRDPLLLLFIVTFPPHPLPSPTRKHYPLHPPAPVEMPGQPRRLPRDVTYPTLLT
jgi:parafibromin